MLMRTEARRPVGRSAPFLPKPSLYARGNPRAVTQHLGELGWVMPLVSAAAAAYGSKGGGGGAAPAGGGPGGPGAPGSSTNVSPNIQTDVSPHISPVFSQMQDSAGAVQAATTTQYKPGGQTATSGQPMTPTSPLSTGAPMNFNKPGGLPASPLDPVHLTDISRIPTAGDMIRDIRESQPFNMTPVVWIAGIGAVMVLGLIFLRDRRKK